MTLVFALAAATLFGTGAFLLLERDLVRVVLGVVLISQASVLTLIASGLTRGGAPIYPLTDRPVSDPLSQAMALTAIVIGLAVTALLLVLVLRVVIAYRTEDLDELDEQELDREVRAERRVEKAHEQEEEAIR